MRGMSETNAHWVNWTQLEQTIPLDNLPTFHRDFLAALRQEEANWHEAPLRQVQGKVQASLKQLERLGDVRRERESNAIWIKLEHIPSAYRHYLTQDFH